MAWVTGKLTDAAIRNAKPKAKIRKLSDGKGLQFWVTPEGGRYWRMDYRFQGKRKLLSFGTYPEMGVAMARQQAVKAREVLANGLDPAVLKKEAKTQAAAETKNTFGVVAAKLLISKAKAGRAAATLAKLKWVLSKVAADLNHRAVTSIKTPEVRALVAREVDLGNVETARRIHIVLGMVFNYAIEQGISENNPVRALKRPEIKVAHHAAITDQNRLGELLGLIDQYCKKSELTGRALQLMALLYPRPGELRRARWNEFDLEQGRWQIPADRMKMRRPHTTPLPRQAIEILLHMRELTGPDGYVFPSTSRREPCMSENTMNQALRRMGITKDQHCSHGFRSTASTILNASRLFSIDAIENSLAHSDNDGSRRSYNKDDAMAERVPMAQWWADKLDQLRYDAVEKGA